VDNVRLARSPAEALSLAEQLAEVALPVAGTERSLG